VEGRLTPDKNSGGPRVYQRPDGTTGATYEVFANTVRFLSSRGEGGPGPAPAPSEEDVPLAAEDEIPF
jgi:single-strand DNA-binding protein